MSFLFTRNGDTVAVQFVTDTTDASKLQSTAVGGSGRILVHVIGPSPVFVSGAAEDLDAGNPVTEYTPVMLPHVSPLFIYSPYGNALVFLTPGTNA